MFVKSKKLYKIWTRWYRKDYKTFKSLCKNNDCSIDDNYPCINVWLYACLRNIHAQKAITLRCEFQTL